MYWFHPHVHGLSENQITSGLAGMITVGNVSDYACQGGQCSKSDSQLGIRHLILKDAQVLTDVTLQQNMASASIWVAASMVIR